MINLPTTIPISNSDRLISKRMEQKRVGEIERTADAVTKPPKRGFVERRKQQDRRERGNSAYPLESRASGDRRKGAKKRTPHIDIKA